jgi:uroporphyrinogen-III synthase
LRLLLTRPLDDSRRLAQALAAARHELLIEPLLTIETLAPDIDLQGVQALAVSSRHALGFLAGRDDAQAQALCALPLFAVGSATAEAARTAGFAQVIDAEGDAVALAAALGERLDPAAGAVLHLAGETTAPALADGLANRGLALRRVLAYRAREATQLSTVCRAALAAGQLDGATFLSPRTAAAFARLVLEAGVAERCAGLIAFCLSVAVAKALDGVSWRRVVVAESPRLKDMIAAIATAEQEDRAAR